MLTQNLDTTKHVAEMAGREKLTCKEAERVFHF